MVLFLWELFFFFLVIPGNPGADGDALHVGRQRFLQGLGPTHRESLPMVRGQ